jgi:hypothetical protein
MACSAIPVAADVGGQRELVTPDCGILIPHGPHELAEYVAAIQDILRDPERRAQMGAAARERIDQHFSAEIGLTTLQMALDRAAHLASIEPRPCVPVSAGLAAATLAIEHEQFEQRLRRLAPVRLFLMLRWSSAGRLLRRLAGLSSMLAALDRQIYMARRKTGQLVRRLISAEPQNRRTTEPTTDQQRRETGRTKNQEPIAEQKNKKDKL